jgi:CTP:molybdopterin cytidylyltransferase MocA
VARSDDRASALNEISRSEAKPRGVRYVVLAAGESRRMGFDKTVTPLGPRSPLARVAEALGRRRALIVVPSHLSEVAARIAPAARIVVNSEQARGMAHSLHLALALIERESPFGVLLGDMPSMTEATIDRTEALLRDDVDVAFPVDSAGTPGHPVIFSPRVRSVVEELPDGDTLRSARDHLSLRRATWCCRDRSAFLDLDLLEDWERFVDA